MRKRKRFGLAFSDQLIKVGNPSSHFRKLSKMGESLEDTFIPHFRNAGLPNMISVWRLLTLTILFLITFFGLFLRLFHLQVIQGEENRYLADSNRVQIRIVHAPRGVIYDRNGKVLAENNPAFRIGDKVISRDEALMLEAKNDSSSSELEIDTIRFYPDREAVSHILGYVGQISEDELQDPIYTDYKIGDRIGRAGIEQVYESVLKGQDGAEIIEIDAQGKKLRTLRRIEPTTGKNIYLSIDWQLQKETYDALLSGVIKAKSCCGAAVAQDPNNGQILALASVPSFDGNVFTDPEKNDQISIYFNDPNSPLLNRVVAGVYPPGSTFKITTSLAGLVSGKINQDTQIEDTGVVNLGQFKFANWYFTQYGRKDGMVNVIKALQRSNDIFYYRVGEMIGEEEIAQMSYKLGFGKKLGLDLPGEEEGLVPSNEWKKENTGVEWYPGDTLHLAIGQGFMLTTPLQVLSQTTFIAGNGVLYQPSLVSRITYPEGELFKEIHPSPISENIVKSEYINLVKAGLEAVPKTGGTAWPFFNFPIPTAGKTGTAEFGDPEDKTHAWYTGYGPVGDPTVVATVLIESGGEGSSVASPVVKRIFGKYFNVKIEDLLAPEVVATQSGELVGD